MKLPLADLGSESEKGIVSAFDDLFGPSFRELGLYIADKVRFHRYKSLKQILERAAKLNAGKPFVGEPELKFLIPFAEKASVSNDDDLVDWWARLLGSEMRASDNHNIYFQDVLSRISKREVDLFEDLSLRPVRKRGFLSQIEDSWSFAQRDRLQLIVDSCDEGAEIDVVIDMLLGLTEAVGRRIISIAYSNSEDGSFVDAEEYWHDAVMRRSSLDLLQQLRLVEVLRHDLQSPLYDLSVEICYITQLGAEFFSATHPPEWSMARNARPSGEYPDDGNVSYLDYRAAD